MRDDSAAPDAGRVEIDIGGGYFVRDNGRLYGWGLHDADGDRIAVFEDEWRATTFAAAIVARLEAAAGAAGRDGDGGER